MSSKLYDTLTAGQCRQAEALYHLVMQKAAPPWGLCLALPEPGERLSDSFYGLSFSEGRLASFLSVFCPDGKVAEISGFTHPSLRRRGHFSALLGPALKRLKSRFGSPEVVYQCLTRDPDAEAFIKAKGLSFLRGECLMEAERTGASHGAETKTGPGAGGLAKAAISFRAAGTAERPLLLSLHKKAFGESPEGFIDTVLSDQDSLSRVILADGEPAGLFHLTKSGGALFYLCGFGILPGFRGRGLAKAALSRILADCPAGGRLFLQVSTENAPAFSLYQSMGFLTVNRQDYYGL